MQTTAPVMFEEVTCSAGQKLGMATLNSPSSLNALNLPMIENLLQVLDHWRLDASIVAIVLQGAGDKAFCAGGDITHLYQSMCDHPEGENPFAEKFFHLEYRLDYMIHTYPKPVICWGHGVVMGGGLGLMAGASHRIVTEKSRIAMPEISIGLFPDVGGTWFLNRMPDGTGLFLGLTGATCNATDAVELGWAEAFIPQSQKDAVFRALRQQQWSSSESNHSRVTQLCRSLTEQHRSQAPKGQIDQHRAIIHQVTQGDTLAEVIEQILALPANDPWFEKAQKTLAKGSPISAQLVWRQLQTGGRLSLAEVFQRELIMAIQSTRQGEFREGIRALLIDKDLQPKWRFNTVADVPTEVIDAFFEPPWPENPLKDLGQK